MNNAFSTQLKIGILGGGQLGRMLIQEAINLGLDLAIMDGENAPCGNYAANYTVGDINSYHDVLNFGQNLDVLTIEIESVNIEALYALEKQGVHVYPQPHIIELIQDKGKQKQFYNKHDIPTAEYELVENLAEFKAKERSFPLMQKLRKGGYDGKGVVAIKRSDDLTEAFDAPSVLERFVDLDKELSVIVARDAAGNTQTFPTVEQEFNDEANLVEFLFSPAEISETVAQKASEIATAIITQMGMVGILAVEFFLEKDGTLLVNEIAPRPHNSGHQTIEGNYTSQFEQHLRVISGLPIGSTETIMPSVMINLLGEKGSEGNAHYVGIEEIMEIQGVYPHIYGKEKSKPFRKMGHVTIIHPQLDTAKAIAKKVKETIKVIGK